MATETSCGPPALKFGKNKALATIFLKALNENIAGCLSSIAYLEYIWLATGGKSQLKPEKLSVLKGRQVIAFPDVDGYQEWKEKLSKIESLTITVSDVLEKNATDKERLNHIDIADWLIKWRQECIRQFGGTDAVPFAGHNHSTWDKTDINPENCPTFANPNMQFVTQYFPNTGLNFKNLSMS